MSVAPAHLDPTRGDPCAGASHTAVLLTFAAPQGRPDAEGGPIPLRCGRSDCSGRDGWGYRHFAARWAGEGVAERFHADIAAALAKGRRQRADRGTVRYDLAWADEEGAVDRSFARSAA